MKVSVLYAESPSVYDALCDDVWNQKRDARCWPGGNPAVVHPPCRAWSRLAHFAKPPPGEKELAILAVGQIRKNGGVLEHPFGSALWPFLDLPRANTGMDLWEGWTLVIDQSWWGHKARKRTNLYVCGCAPCALPQMPMRLGSATHTMGLYSKRDRATCRPEVPKRERSSTPIALAKWLLEVARRCDVNAARN